MESGGISHTDVLTSFFCFWWYLFVCCDVAFFWGWQTFVKMLWCDVLVFVSGRFGIYSIHLDEMGVSTIGDTFHFHWTMGPWSYGRIFSPEKNGGDKESDAIPKQPNYPIIPVNSNRQTGEHDFHSLEVPIAKKKKQVCLDFVEFSKKILRKQAIFFCKKKHHLKPNDVCHICGCFLKWWYPQIIHFNRVFHYKTIHFGVPLSWETPIWIFKMHILDEDEVWETGFPGAIGGGFSRYVWLDSAPTWCALDFARWQRWFYP